MAFVVVDQHIHLMSPAVLGNCYTTICMNQKDPRDMRPAAQISLVEDRDQKRFSELPVGQGVVKLQDRWHQPVLIQIPLIKLKKGAVSDNILRRYLDGTLGLSQLRRRMQPDLVPDTDSPLEEDTLDENELAFLDDVITHPSDGVDARYRRLGLSVGRGNRTKNQLVRKGYLSIESVATHGTHRTLLRLSHKGAAILGKSSGSSTGESLGHEYWKHWYANLYQSRGYTVEIEAPRNGGRVDVKAVKGRESVGIEVETGKSELERNVRNCLRSGYTQVVIVATDETAFRVVEERLARAGLLIPNRLSFRLQDKHLGESEIV